MNQVNCNCRHVQIDLSSLNGTLDNSDYDQSTLGIYTGCQNLNPLCLMIESMLIHWDMLETVYITDDKARIEIWLNASSHYNAEYLRILHLDQIKVKTLGENIDKWKNLEYLYISHAHFNNWPHSFSKLNKISFLQMQDSYLQNLPNLCLMENLRGINIEQSLVASYSSDVYISYLPDCIINLDQLQSIILYSANIVSFPAELLSMPSIEEIGFLFDEQFGVEQFLSIINRSLTENGLFLWNKPSQTVYSFSLSTICDEMTNYDLAGLSNEYDNLANIEILKEFLNNTQACEQVCNFDTLHILVCSPFRWQNGVCDSECNVAACNYDGGDCNQLCQIESPDCYTVGLFNNGICDKSCNISTCEYDKYECIDSQLEIEFEANISYCNENYNSNSLNIDSINNISNFNSNSDTLCHVNWVNDKICDNNCYNNENCFYDGIDCQCSQDYESQGYCQWMIPAIAASGAVEDAQTGAKFDQHGFCTLWLIVDSYASRNQAENGMKQTTNWEESQGAIFNALLDYYYEYPNCTVAFQQLDTNQDNYADLNEYFQAFSEVFNITHVRASQINCSYALYC